MRLMTRKRSYFNFVSTRQMYFHVLWPIFKSMFIVPHVILFFRPPQSHNALSTGGNSFLSPREDNFDIFKNIFSSIPV